MVEKVKQTMVSGVSLMFQCPVHPPRPPQYPDAVALLQHCMILNMDYC